MIGDTYFAIANRLRLAVPVLKTIGWYSGQLEDPAGNKVVHLPATFIRFADVRWRDTGRGVQVGDLSMDVIVISAYGGDWSPNAAPALQDDAKASLATADFVHAALQGFSTQWLGGLSRSQTATDHQPAGGWIAHILAYRGQLTDPSADTLRGRVAVTPTFNVTGEIDGSPPDASDPA
jgi:hypothetical protein